MNSRTRWITGGILLIAALMLAARFAIPAYRERAAIEALRAAGCRVDTSYRGPEWARSLVNQWCPVPWRPGFVDEAWQVIDKHPDRDPQQTVALFGELVNLSGLRVLVMRGSSIDDQCIYAFGSLHNLRGIGLFDTSITDGGIESIRHLPWLKELVLNGAKISDRSIDVMVEFPALETLSLDRTAITDAGLDKLARLKTLRELSISQTDTSDAAIDRLHDAIPGVQITDD